MPSRIIIIFFFSTLFSVRTDFDIIEAHSQKWHGGRKETGSGINYTVKILTHRNSKALEFSGIWVGSKYFDLQYRVLCVKTGDSVFAENDTLLISFSERIGGFNEIDKTKENTVSLPYKYKGEALIKYSYKRKIKYAVVKKIKQLPEQFYP
jgi:hypothetical protein